VILGRIFTHNDSNYAQSRNKVPLWGLHDGRPHLGGQIPQKPATNRQKIGHFVREVDDIEEWRQWRDARLRCCKCIVQGQTTGHSFTACMSVIQSHTKFSRSQGNFIVNVKSQFIWMYWKMRWRHLTNEIIITSENDDSSCSFTASQTEQNTYNCKTAHIVNILILCTSTEHVFNVSAVLSNSIQRHH